MHTASEQIAMYRNTAQAIAEGESKHQIEVLLSETADVVVGIGPKLRHELTGPGIAVRRKKFAMQALQENPVRSPANQIAGTIVVI